MAITITNLEVENVLNLGVNIVEPLYPVAEALIMEYVRGSTIPAGVENEALVRLVAFMASTAKTNQGVKSQQVDDLKVEYFSNHKNAMKNSGAESLLTRFKQRRAV